MKKKCYCGNKEFKEIEVKIEEIIEHTPYGYDDSRYRRIDVKVCVKCGLMFCFDWNIIKR